MAGDALARLAALRAAREPLYAEVAHLRLETAGMDPEEAARRIVRAYREV
ncbi:MAG: hypothetical protein ACPL8I_15410 [Chloroflexaceae bacterium]